MQKANCWLAMAREAGLKARFHFMYVRKTPSRITFPSSLINGGGILFHIRFPKSTLTANGFP